MVALRGEASTQCVETRARHGECRQSRQEILCVRRWGGRAAAEAEDTRAALSPFSRVGGPVRALPQTDGCGRVDWRIEHSRRARVRG